MGLKINSYAFGHIVIEGSSYTSDVIVLPDRVLEGWRREDAHRLDPADLYDALLARPDVIIVGTGCYGVMEVPEATAAYVRERCVELIALDTAGAVAQYNALSGGRRVAAALHLTC